MLISEENLRLLIRKSILMEEEGILHINKKKGLGMAVVCYSDTDFFGKGIALLLSQVGYNVKKEKVSGNPKGWWSGYVPQGHAWILLVDPSSGDVIKCNFGSRSCNVGNIKSKFAKLAIWLGKKGIPILSANKVEISKIGTLSDVSDEKASSEEIKKIIQSDRSRVTNYFIVKGVNYSRARQAAGKNGECRPYNLIPFSTRLGSYLKSKLPSPIVSQIALLSASWENCGSYTLDVLSVGLGFGVSTSQYLQAATLPGTMIEMAKALIPKENMIAK